MKCRHRSQMMVSSFVRQAISRWRILAIGAVAVALLLTACSSSSGRVNGNPAWSPDGSKIAFTSDRDGNDEIYVMNADGSNQTRLTETEAMDDDPAWSPDGTKIAFDSGQRDTNNSDIWVMNADGSNQTRLTETEAWDDNPAWSPDGTKIVFASDRDGNADIWVMDADGSNQTRLTETE